MRESMKRLCKSWEVLGSAILVSAALVSSAAAAQVPSDSSCTALLDSLGREPSGQVRLRAFACADRADSMRRMRVFERMSRQMVALAQLPWKIPEYHDEQPFADGGKYGPMAYIFASPYISAFNYVWQIRAQAPLGILAAVVFVDAPAGTPLTESYTKLFLQPGMNCIWLANNTSIGPGKWTASVSAASGDVCDRNATTPVNSLDVTLETFTGLAHKDYPGAARFDEASNGLMLLGVQCLAGWCEIGPPGASPRPGLGGKAREGLVRGWHDNQRLSVRDASGLHPGPRASIVPMPNLDKLSPADYSSWRKVATIIFHDDPAGTKYATWGLKLKANLVEGRFSSGNWEYRVTPLGGGPTKVWNHVNPMPHYDAPVPGSVRWRWTLLDEGIWIPCGNACCHADGY